MLAEYGTMSLAQVLCHQLWQLPKGNPIEEMKANNYEKGKAQKLKIGHIL